jgi:hypothetical protein
MPTKRRCLRHVATATAASVAGCASLLPENSDSSGQSEACQGSPNAQGTEYDFSRAGQILAKPEEPESDKWPEIEFADCLHPQLRTAVEDAHETGQLSIHEISADEREEITENLHSRFGVTSAKFYVFYQQEPIQIRIVQND